MIQVTPVILCGGSGTRLWPLSRTGFPKQFLSLTGKESLFQQTIQRLSGLHTPEIDVAAPYTVSNEQHRFLVMEQLREIGVTVEAALLEPEGRNTAPALTLAALSALETGEDPVLVVTPADQTIANIPTFTQAIRTAITEATNDTIVILGVPPDRPETGYGYLQVDRKTDTTQTAHIVTQFVEKPDIDTAQHYLHAGNYYWNAGICVLRASTWLQTLTQYRPDIASATQLAWQTRTQDATFIRPGHKEFAAIPAESIDYAVLEQCPNSEHPIKTVPLDAGWSDLGTWDSVWRSLPKNKQGNIHQGDVITTNSRNTLVQATSRLVSVVGVQNLIVIETPDAVVIADKTHHQDIKQIVNTLDTQKRQEHITHRKVHRPWGWYDTIDEGAKFKVKRIQVKPQASLSLQMHHHRAEHWTVVRGIAEVTQEEQVFRLTENQSTYIPQGATHRLANPGESPLEIIEVQTGSYLGEDDIVRFADTYGRHTC